MKFHTDCCRAVVRFLARLTNGWSRRGCHRDEVVGGWEATLSVVAGAGHGPPRGSAPTLGGASRMIQAKAGEKVATGDNSSFRRKMNQHSQGGEVFTMLGEKLSESSGRIIGIRVLPPDAQGVKVEMSFQGSGSLLGEAMTENATYWQTVKPGGALYGEGRVLFTTKEGEMALWTGFGVGTPTGSAPAAKLGVCGSFQTASQKLARLTNVAVVTEFEVDEDGSYHYESWEWK